ncbi:hypothetical protein J0S82_008881 [Galemys pyrenaicus]|uniref:Uncharacterized protein n=1 Tax=Galemys pyrenaicus TaxID=202257 RepID=A0A8J6A1S2_GALPY|nr:hypothetical protein J0S82_008881 [Galemys pyrenaicus]
MATSLARNITFITGKTKKLERERLERLQYRSISRQHVRSRGPYW